MNMKLLRSLQIFVEVAESGSMSIAARNLHMTVSAISQQLRKLEQDKRKDAFIKKYDSKYSSNALYSPR